ncbi:MAG: hypothetical protein JRF07_10115, partial [Deltaproteobacteria bacterium]|nr:hypothetical protein [Deltaproteobacteria bacterium]
MNLLDQLRQVTLKAQIEADLPDDLAGRIFCIANDPDRYRLYRDDIQDLINKICIYDTYAQTGYVGMGVDHLI